MRTIETGLRCAACAMLMLSSILVAVPASSAATDPDFHYYAQAGDTLIGLGRRLLLEPRRWHDLQLRNHIVDPRRIPPGEILRIPYDWLRSSAKTATVSGLAGSVQAGGRAIVAGEGLTQGVVIETGADGSITLDLADGSIVTLQKSSVLALDEMTQIAGVSAANSIRLKLQSGRVEAKVKPHRDVGRFEIITPVAVSAVRGTEFRSGYGREDQHATTETLEGTVGVGGGDPEVVAVAAGFGTRVEKDRPPLAPVKLLPPPGLTQVPEVNGTPQFAVQLVGVAGAARYRIQLSADEHFHSLAADVLTTDGRTRIADLPDGVYYLRARSIDDLGLEGPDAVRRVEQHRLPAPPGGLAATQGMLSSSVPTSSAAAGPGRVRLSWTAVNGAVRYAVQLSADAAFSASPVQSVTVVDAGATIGELVPGRYYWRVASINERNETGDWSPVQAYAQPVLMPMPDVPRREGKQLRFGWQSFPGLTYRVQVARDVQFTQLLSDQKSTDAEWSCTTLAPGSYYVRVAGIDVDQRMGPFGPARPFTVPIPLWVKILGPLAALALLL